MRHGCCQHSSCWAASRPARAVDCTRLVRCKSNQIKPVEEISGRALAAQGPCGSAVRLSAAAAARQCFGNALAMLWECVGNALANAATMLWQYFGNASANAAAMLRQSFGNALALLRHCSGNAAADASARASAMLRQVLRRMLRNAAAIMLIDDNLEHKILNAALAALRLP